jgi:uncharacterized protein (TIGR02246 family)
MMSSCGVDRCCGIPGIRLRMATPRKQALASVLERLCHLAFVATLAAALAWAGSPRGLADDDAPADADAEAAVRAAAVAYAEAFNAGDMDAVAAQWAERAELVEADTQLVGRERIVAAIKAGRAKSPNVRMVIEVDDVKFITSGLARVTGRLAVRYRESGPMVTSEFSSLRVLEQGRWVLAESLVLSAPQASLGDVGWMTGTWKGTTVSGEPLTIRIAQELDGMGVISRLTVGPADSPLLTAIDVIQADAVTGRLRSWTFDSTGSRAEGVLMSDGSSFNRVVEGIPAAGSGAGESRWVQVITPLDANRIAMQSIERSIDGQPIPDTDVIILTRDTP